MNYTQIVIGYWHGEKYADVPYHHLEKRKYTKTELNNVIHTVLESGYNISLIQSPEQVIVWIDKGMFIQS